MRVVRGLIWTGCVSLLCLAGAGCMSGPLVDNPVRVEAPLEETANPVYLPLGGTSGYHIVFDTVVDVLDDYFEIDVANIYDGRIDTIPVIAPGLGQPWKAGSPDVHERLLATLQSIRLRCEARIHAADGGGFFVDVKVFRELEDLPQPYQQLAGAATFRGDNVLQREYSVIDPTIVSHVWIPVGRDVKLEQEILARLTGLHAAREIYSAR